MRNKAITVDLDPGNLLWLRSQVLLGGQRSVSEVLNEILAKVRTGGPTNPGPVRSVKGTIEIAEDDPDLAGADEAIRSLFLESFERSSEQRRRVGGGGGTARA